MRGGYTTTPILGGFCLTGSLLVFALGTLPEKPEAPGPAIDPEAVSTARSAWSQVPQEHPGKKTFQQYCAPCHGEKGKGDGPAAAAFDPPPADFTNPEGLPKLTDEQVLEVITKGRRSMPAWGAILTPEQLTPLVAYLRELSQGKG